MLHPLCRLGALIANVSAVASSGNSGLWSSLFGGEAVLSCHARLPSPQASDASGTGLYDLAAGRWDTSRLAALGDRAASCLPELVGPNEVRPRWRRFAGGGNCRSCCLAGLPPASWAAQAGAPSPSRVGCALNYATTQRQTTSKPRMPCAPFPSQHRPTDWPTSAVLGRSAAGSELTSMPLP